MPFWAQKSTEEIRHTRYAGSWYESDPHKLKSQIERFLNLANPIVDQSSTQLLSECNPPLAGTIEAIIVPHAGFLYSGTTAAFAFKAAQAQKIQRIFLLGPSHHVALRGACLPSATLFQTPFGDLKVDSNTVDALKSYPLFSIRPEIHEIEHSLEMQLPFIYQAFGKIKIVPIVIGELKDESEARSIAKVLRSYMQEGDLVVVSSDFTHYGPRYGYSPFSSNIEENIRRLDSQAFTHLSKGKLTDFIAFQKETGDTICGIYPCQVLSALLPINSAGTLLKYSTSSDVHVDEEHNSVSYLAIAFCGEGWGNKAQPKLSQEEKNTLLILARKTLESYVINQHIPSAEELELKLTPSMQSNSGVFVTLKRRDGGESSLRGCIGSIYPVHPLYKAVQENTLSASCKDYRFSPVEKNELPLIEIDINVLTVPHKVASYKDIVLGRDGIILKKNGKQSVFLPQVAVEWKWSLEETLKQLSQKAGLNENDWQTEAEFAVFQSEEFH